MPPAALPTHLRPLTSLKQLGRTWFVLVTIVGTGALLIWTNFAPPPHRLGGLFGLLPLSFVLVLRKVLRRHQATRLLENGARRLEAGDLAAAEQDFEEAAHKDLGPLRALAVYNLAIAKFQRGDLERAAQLLEAADESRQLYNDPLLQEALLDKVALCRALWGQVAEARLALVRSAGRHRESTGPLAILPEAVVLARSGHPAAAAKLLETRWRAVEAPGGTYTRMARLVRALVLESLDGARHQAAAADALAGARLVSASDVAPLCTGWPEMEGFLRAKGLLPSTLPPSPVDQ